ncbi:pyridoxal phosphate-dependent aminotransferase [Dermatobacter hominis]|uniref:pyridoxal phosphate-dependent aminotransferase n=1 Tax=Dermatobacter hominis TaxID=2884263 RepID=UPI001D0F6DDF|nr:pyridoxal phosphate-dependent aminotransferase [Dermatobacter hominis]UDY36322.1 pyridoxal phosphate-dependent aminotransferase [Dermatobacter hominis]
MDPTRDPDPLASRLRGFGTTIFAEMSALAERTGAINLGQGVPDDGPPPEVLDAAIAAIRAGRNQYPPGPGVPALREAVAAHRRRFWGIDLDPDTEVLVTVGATEAIAAAVLALCEPGDEVVAFQPTYDSYGAAVAMAGAQLRPVTLRGPDFALDVDELRDAVTPRTRLLLVNSPHNPTGRVLGDDELTAIADLCVERDLIAVTDEVYEHLVFDGVHRPLSTFPGMAERTLSISSAGKTFSCTGWKVGWATGPAALVAATRTAKQFLTFTAGGPFQEAVAVGLGLDDDVFRARCDALRTRRDVLCAGLERAGFGVRPPASTYFVTADIGPLGADDGVEFCRSLPERCGVVAVPTSVFFDDPRLGARLVRFAYCKDLALLEEAVERLVA